MKKLRIILGIIAILSLGGCASNNDDNRIESAEIESDEIESMEVEYVDLETVTFKIQVEDIFDSTNPDTAVFAGLVEKGIVSKGDTIILVNKEGEVKSQNKVLALDVFKSTLEEASEGDVPAIVVEGITKEEISIGDYYVKE